MRYVEKWTSFLFVIVVLASCKNNPRKEEAMAQTDPDGYYSEPYRPQFHFSPEENWMNDPNGMVYNDGTYHLFYQYYPDSTVWGPMHWGHAVSRDLLHWEHKPIALYPDGHGYIFSGSAVLDKDNTSGFGTDGNPPLVAVFTYHDAEKKTGGETGFETQGIAYSLDNGNNWTTFDGNPVVMDKASTDFRDPKVFWYEPDEKWVMSLVAGDHAEFYGSKNLKDWELLGEFGKDAGAHGGVWECPDLFRLPVEGTDEGKWVLLISINPGAPNGGSGTQYFIGDFDGKDFTSDQKETRWIDWGTDNYAGVTYSNVPGDEKIFIGWMSNWQYAQKTPTEKWRGAMTLPRKLSLKKIGGRYELINYPIDGLDALIGDVGVQRDVSVQPGDTETVPFDSFSQAEVRFTTTGRDFSLSFKNEKDEKLVLTLDGGEKQFLLDRTESGKTDFQENFGMVQKMPVANLPEGEYEVRILMDASSVELFINEGQYVMTAQVFPTEEYGTLEIGNPSDGELKLKDFTVSTVERVW